MQHFNLKQQQQQQQFFPSSHALYQIASLLHHAAVFLFNGAPLQGPNLLHFVARVCCALLAFF